MSLSKFGKNIWCIRHGLSLHNIMYKHIGQDAYMKLNDTSLLYEGYEEAVNLNKTWDKINEIDVVFVSPLTRTIQTAINVFKDVDVKLYALDLIKEYPYNYERINNRKNKTFLQKKYGELIDFSYLQHEEDPYWCENNKETVHKLKNRISDTKKFLKKIDEQNIALVSHSSYIHCFLYDNLDDENVELKHCHPYHYGL